VLVLDDALSSVDTRTEHAILDHLRGVMAGCTSIVIAHRVSTVMDADHIAVIDEGRIVEFGNHPAPLARDGSTPSSSASSSSKRRSRRCDRPAAGGADLHHEADIGKA
jgi:ABC-type bacteriocin/lantibiotic exporter with double-glycine peptidase domain